jgi:leader peptidase (prepilin peptidase)/N-methyltransferase
MGTLTVPALDLLSPLALWLPVLLVGPLLPVAVAVAGLPAGLLAVGVLLVALVPVVVVDVRRRIVPDIVVLPAAALALALHIAAEPSRWWVPVAAALGAAGAVTLLWALRPDAMGLGDAKLALLMGAALGGAVVVALVAGFLAGALVGLGLVARRGWTARRATIPFAPCLAAGCVVAVAWAAAGGALAG